MIQVHGLLRARPEGTENKDLASGTMELVCDALTILNTCLPLPFVIDEHASQEVSEEVRLKYRYLDLRRADMAKSLSARSALVNCVRSHLQKLGFLDIENPNSDEALSWRARVSCTESCASRFWVRTATVATTIQAVINDERY